MRYSWIVPLLALGACGSGDAVTAEPDASEPEAAQTAPQAEDPADAEPSDAGRIEALLAQYFQAVEDGTDADALFPPGGAPTLFDDYAPVTLVEHELGEPLLEGAAGSIYASVPARIVFIEDMTGEEQRLEGNIVLRRVNDVPGASADQLRWRFDRFEDGAE